MRSLAAFVGFILLCAASPLRAQEPTVLRYRFEKGATLNTRDVVVQKMKMSMDGQAQETGSEQEISVRRTVAEADAGSASFRQKIERVKATLSAGGQTEAYDSGDPASVPGPMTRGLAVLAGREFSYRMSDRGAISEFQSMGEGLAEALQGTMQDPAAFAQSMANAIQQSFPQFPEGPLTQGQSWSQSVRTPIPNVGAMVMTLDYTWAGNERVHDRDCLKLDFSMGATIEVREGSGITAEVTVEEGAGVVFIDRQVGLVVGGNSRLRMISTYRFQQGGAAHTLIQELNQQQKTELDAD